MITWPVFGVLMVHRRVKRGQQLAPQGGAHRTHCQRRRGADRAGQVHGARADLRGGRRLVVQANLGGPRAGDLLTREDQTRRPLDANQAGQRFGRPEAVMNTQPGEVRGEPRVVGGDPEVGDQRRLAEPRPLGALRTRLAGTVRGSGRAPSPSGRLTPSCAAPQAPRFRFP